MDTLPPCPPVRKKGMGCCGIGCLILALLALLFAAFVGLGGYGIYAEFLGITSPTPLTVPSFDGGDDVYNQAVQKLNDFNQALRTHQAATLHLKADEINTLIARNPNFAQNNIHLFLALHDDQGDIQASLPASVLTRGYLFKDRYLNGNVSTALNFDSSNKSLNLDLRSLAVGPQNPAKADLPSYQAVINPYLNAFLQSNPQSKSLLQQTKSIVIKDGELIVEIE